SQLRKSYVDYSRIKVAGLDAIAFEICLNCRFFTKIFVMPSFANLILGQNNLGTAITLPYIFQRPFRSKFVKAVFNIQPYAQTFDLANSSPNISLGERTSSANAIFRRDSFA
ncbi:MAG: hypothetical protein NZ937_09655, partial [Armatimonadetes bacterium]|nr:hypothetical protein [Armatimonadota bacterium]